MLNHRSTASPLPRRSNRPASAGATAGSSLAHAVDDGMPNQLLARGDERQRGTSIPIGSPAHREELISSCEAAVMSLQCKKTLTALHRLRDRLQQEIHYQRRAASAAFASEVRAAAALRSRTASSSSSFYALSRRPQRRSQSVAREKGLSSATAASRRSGSAQPHRATTVATTSSSAQSLFRVDRLSPLSHSAGPAVPRGADTAAPPQALLGRSAAAGAAVSQADVSGAASSNSPREPEEEPSSSLPSSSSHRRRRDTAAYGFVLLRRINRRVERLRVLAGLAEERMLRLSADCRGGGVLHATPQRRGRSSPAPHAALRPSPASHHRSVTSHSFASSPARGGHTSTSAPPSEREVAAEVALLGDVVRTATRSVADFARLEGEALALLSAL